MKHLSILFLIFLVITISGCIGQDVIVVSTKDGVIITDFSFEHSPVYAEDNVGLGLEVQNVGDNIAQITKIQLYGVDFTSGSSSTEREWRILGTGSQEVNINDLPSKGELYQPDPDINLEAAKDYYEWRLQAPLVAAKTDYDFHARVEYSYTTTYTGIIRVINDDYLQTLNEEERQKLFSAGGMISSETTNGPISVTPFASRHFIVTPGETGEREIKFKVENVGKGYTYADDQKYSIKLVDIRPKLGVGGIIASCNGGEPIIKLSSGKSHIFECDFVLPTDVKNKMDKTFQLEFGYYYYVDDSASITVKPAY